MLWQWRNFVRQFHRWGAVVVAIPFLLVVATGILLLLKKEVAWIQPPTAKGTAKVPSISWEALLDAVRSQPQAEMQSWDDIQRLDMQPKRGIIKVQGKSSWEVQVDFQTGKVLATEYRRSDFIESLHDGSWFHDGAKLGVFLPCALVVLGLWFTGIYLFFLPLCVKWGRRKPGAPAGPV